MTTPTKAKKVSIRAVHAAVNAVADRTPHHRDRRTDGNLSPRYLDSGQPNCLVALVLLELGFPETLLRALDRERPVGSIASAGVRIAESRHPALRRIDPVALQLLQHLQNEQDRGCTWTALVEETFRVNRWFPLRTQLRRKPWLADLEPQR